MKSVPTAGSDLDTGGTTGVLSAVVLPAAKPVRVSYFQPCSSSIKIQLTAT